MDRVAATPQMAQGIYERMAKRLAVVRRRRAKPLTLSEKFLLGHLADPETQGLEPGRSYLKLFADRVVLQDVLGQTAFLQFMQTGRDEVAVPTTVHCDHLIRAERGAAADLKTSHDENTEIYEFLKSAAARYGAGFWEPGAGIIHQVVLEQYAFPGQVILGTDSHTPNGGGLGACAIGVGGADAVEAMAGMAIELLYPKRIAIHLTGQLNGWTAPKDVVLWALSQLTVSGGTNAVIEYIGAGARTISATGKATICNMGAEMGATTSLFPADDRMATYLEATDRAALVPLIRKYADLLAPDAEVEANPEAHYDQVLRLDLSTLEPHVSGPHSPDRSRPLSVFIREVRENPAEMPEAVSSVLTGSCTNSSYEDVCRATDVAAQAAAHGLKSAVPLLVTPGSERIRATISGNGQLEALTSAGAQVLANACGPCIGQWTRADATNGKPNFIVTTFNRNFRARNDGRGETMNLITSPELAMAFAFAGRVTFNPLTDSLTGADGREFKLNPPAPAPEVPKQGFAKPGGYHAPAEKASVVEVKVDPASKRLQRLSPWPKWDGVDIVDIPVLVKVVGKTTTDHISPAGPWLSLRGHLDRFSDNLLMGATNAWTGERGTTRDIGNGGAAQSIAAVARAYKARGLRWAIVADSNYGEGSSREHAALSPRLLNGAAVIARSFARIHESNLKKQGLLALTFTDPADYERIRDGDRISLLGLKDMKAGKPVICQVSHADGTQDALELRHTYSEEQLEWFRSGSALNCIPRERAA
ncbi:MAG TPA: aconitate hydratase [Burkholderiales bacterium]|nr:aconitate hydratase [Burkholderiales bacterium]